MTTSRRFGAPLISWHRGGQELTPSATLAAFVAAARHGAELIEVDVRRSRDGVLLCVHDPIVPALGNVAEIVVGDLSDDQRRSLLTYEQFCARGFIWI